MTSVDISYYDQINNLICPFCSNKLLNLIRSNILFGCSNNCMEMSAKQIFLSGEYQWNWISIYLENNLEIFVSRTSFEQGLRLCGQKRYLPHFNIFDYPLLELNQKIKQYLIFL